MAEPPGRGGKDCDEEGGRVAVGGAAQRPLFLPLPLLLLPVVVAASPNAPPTAAAAAAAAARCGARRNGEGAEGGEAGVCGRRSG